MTAYYNEIEPGAVAVLRQLIADGVIAPGVVDTRSIKDVQPDDLAGFTQCHFFAGGAIWSVAARMAGWPDDRPLWTGSCPCQPISVAGKGLGALDPRHLWPDFHRLIRGAKAAGFGPAVVMGEQVSGAAGYNWLDGVRADLAQEGYACRARDIPALAVDAPHERNRLYWIAVECDPGPHGLLWYRGHRIGSGPVAWPSPVADGDGGRELQRQGDVSGQRGRSRDGHAGNLADGDIFDGRPGAGWRDGAQATNDHGGSVVDAPVFRRGEGWAEYELRSGRPAAASADASGGAMGDAFGSRLEEQSGHGDGRPGGAEPDRSASTPDGRNGSWWADAEWIICHDDKARRTKSGLRLLVDGMPGRVGLWRIAGNAIVAPLAAEVIKAFLDAEADRHLRLTAPSLSEGPTS